MKRNRDRVLSEWLVLNAQIGSRDALEQLCRLWQPKLTRYVQRLIDDHHCAEDIVQQVFEQVIRDLHKIRDAAAFPQWIYQILQRRSADELRRRQRDRQAVRDLTTTEWLNTENPTLDPHMNFESMLAGLNDEFYRIIHLYYLEGFSVAEISQILSIPTGTVKSRLHHARKQLQLN